MFAAEIEEGKELVLEIQEGRQAYVLCIDGTAMLTMVNHQKDGSVDVVCRNEDVVIDLEKHDAAEIVGPVSVITKGGGGPVHLLVVEMSHDARSDGRGDV